MAKKSNLGILLNKKFSQSIKDVHKPIEVIPSGSIILDKLMGVGGYPMGRITEIFGPYSSGKTTLALEAAASCQKLGKVVIFMDFERSFHKGHAESIGVDVDNNFYVLVPDHLEHGEAILQEILLDEEASEEIGLIIFDSVSAMQPRAIVEGEADSKTMGAQAREIARFLSKFSKWISKDEVCCIFLNQERTNIKTSMYEPGPTIQSSGGKAIQFYNSIKIHLKQTTFEEVTAVNPYTGKSEKIKKTSTVRATCLKNKVGPPFLRGDIIMTFGKGVDNGMAVLGIARNEGKIEKKGTMYTYQPSGGGDEVTIRGWDNTVKHFMDNPEEFKGIEEWFRHTSLGKADENELKEVLADSGLEDDFNER